MVTDRDRNTHTHFLFHTVHTTSTSCPPSLSVSLKYLSLRLPLSLIESSARLRAPALSLQHHARTQQTVSGGVIATSGK